eukprot:scaffold8021_cov79-Skeletonema_marinoi.AAC.11
MVYDFGNKTLVNPDTLEVVPSNNLFVTGCNPYEGVSKHTNPPWKAYNGCELTPAQTFDSTSAVGYDEALCAFSYPKFNEDGNCDTTRTRHTQVQRRLERMVPMSLIISNVERAPVVKTWPCI